MLKDQGQDVWLDAVIKESRQLNVPHQVEIYSRNEPGHPLIVTEIQAASNLLNLPPQQAFSSMKTHRILK